MSGCRSKTSLKKRSEEVANLWKNDSSLKMYDINTNTAQWNKLWEKTTGYPFEPGADFKVTDFNKMELAIKKFSSDLKNEGTLSNVILKNLYVGRSVWKKNPIIKDFARVLINANEFRNKHTQSMMQSYANMIDDLKFALMEFDGYNTRNEKLSSSSYALRDIISPKNVISKRMANKKFQELNNLESDYVLKNLNEASTSQEWQVLRNFLENEGSAFEDIFSVIENGNDAALKYKYRIVDKSKGKIVSTTVDPEKRNYIMRINRAADSWKEIQEYSKTHLVQSVNNLIETIPLKYSRSSSYAKKLVDEYKSIASNLQKFEGAYVPHYLLDLLGHVNNISQDMQQVNNKNQKRVDKILTEYRDQAKEINTSLISRLKKRSGETSQKFSRNPIQYAEKYISEVIRFNHSSFVDKAYIKGLNKLTEIQFKNPNTKESKAIDTYKDILADMYQVGTNKNRVDTDPTFNNIMRILTSLQFVSKLGFSTRGALRNATQRLLNSVYLGTLIEYDSKVAYDSDKELKQAMESELDKRGLMFTEVSRATEGALEKIDFTANGVGEMNNIGQFTPKELSVSQKLLQGTAKNVGSLADASSFLTKKAENSNRSSTFRVAFYKRVQQLKGMDTYANIGTNADLKAKMYHEAGNYASRITSLLHFEYAPFAKSKLFRSGFGQFVGQFQHYLFSFAQLQKEMVSDYVRAYKAGDYMGEEFARIARLSTLYALVELASVLGDVNIGSYINNPLIDKVKGFQQLLSDDPDVASNAFYGKGIIGATGIVPLSDAIELYNLGHAAGYYNLLADPESTAGFLMGMREYDSIDNKELLGEVAGMFSIQGERLVNRTWPALTSENGGLVAAIRAELGVYPGETPFGFKTRSSRKKLLKDLNIMPDKKVKNPLIPVYMRKRNQRALSQKDRDLALKSLNNLV